MSEQLRKIKNNNNFTSRFFFVVKRALLRHLCLIMCGVVSGYESSYGGNRSYHSYNLYRFAV